jgi:anti-sigma regulatory factor (Ser/Thr protein kinase)
MSIESHLTVPARPEYTRVLRLVADGVAADAGLDMDRIDDVELAIDEAAAALIEQTGSTELALTLSRYDSSVRVRLAGNGSPAGLRLDELRGIVLDAVTDGIEIAGGGITLHFDIGPASTAGGRGFPDSSPG